MKLMTIGLASIIVATAISTTTTARAAEIDIIELYNSKDGLQKTLEVSDFDDTEELLTAVANALDSDNEDDSDDSSDSDDGDSSSASSSENNNDFQNVMSSANEAYNEEIDKFQQDEIDHENLDCHEDEVIVNGQCEPIDDIPSSPISSPADGIPSAAAAATGGAAAAAATSIPFPSGPPVNEISAEEPPQSNDADNQPQQEGEADTDASEEE